MNITHHELGRDRMYKIWHSGEECMMIYVYSNGGSIVFQDRIYPMTCGTLCFIKKGVLHYTMPSEPARYDRSKLYISDETVCRLAELSHEDKKFYDLFAKNTVVFAQIPFEEMQSVEQIYKRAEECFKTANRQAEFISCAFELMLYLKKHSTEQILSPNDPLSNAIEYINRNYFLGVTLDEICEKAHMSKYHFCRRFKKVLNTTVMGYLLNTRIAAAKTTLLVEDLTINEVSEKCGFSSFSYFCQAFKKHTGVTPSAYKKANRS